MKFRILLLFLGFLFLSFQGYGQGCVDNPCPPGYACDMVHGAPKCITPGGGGPPPPGLPLPINSKITWLLAGGMLLGIYYTRVRKPA